MARRPATFREVPFLPRITPNQIAMGIGTGGAMVDVTQYAQLDTGIVRTWGRQSEFDDTTPGQFTFTLDNYDGRFTPNNPSSPLATTVVEGMPVTWLLGTRVIASTILSIQPAFPSDQAPWSTVQITCDDMLGNAGRNVLTNLPDSIQQGAGQLLMYTFGDEAGSSYASEVSNRYPPLKLMVGSSVSTLIFGQTTDDVTPTVTVPSIPGFPGTQMSWATTNSDTFVASSTTTNFQYPQTSLGFWSVWYTGTQLSEGFVVHISIPGLTDNIGMNIGATGITLIAGTHQVNFSTPFTGNTTFYYFSVGFTTAFAAGVWTITGTAYVNGVAVATGVYSQVSGPVTSLTNALRQPYGITIFNINGAPTEQEIFSRLSHTLSLPHEEFAALTTEAGRIHALDATTPEIAFDNLPPFLSASPLGFNDVSTQSVLDALTDVMRTEQGQIYSKTTGTLLSATELLEVRWRDRTPIVSASFDAERELSASPEFVRDITNMVATLEADGPDNTVFYTDPTMFARVGSATGQETVLLETVSDLTIYSQDRTARGKNVNQRVLDISVDAMITPTDRSASLLSVLPGDRHHITDLPTNQLGFTTWDGWVIGGQETISLTENTFQFYYQPVLPFGISYFNAARFSAGGCLSLSAALTSSATTMSVATTGATITVNATHFPFNMIIDSEIITVTACTSATPQVATITRGALGTTAAAHSSGANVEMADVTTYSSFRANMLNNPSGRRSLTGYSVLGSTNPLFLSAGVSTALQASGSQTAGNMGILVGALFVGQNLLPNSTYVFSASVEGSATRGGVFVGGAGVASGGTFTLTAGSGSFSRIFTVFTTAASGVITPYVLNGDPIVSGQTIQFQDAQIELGTTPTTYGDGTISGWAWDTVADNSPSATGGKPSLSDFTF